VGLTLPQYRDGGAHHLGSALVEERDGLIHTELYGDLSTITWMADYLAAEQKRDISYNNAGPIPWP